MPGRFPTYSDKIIRIRKRLTIKERNKIKRSPNHKLLAPRLPLQRELFTPEFISPCLSVCTTKISHNPLLYFIPLFAHCSSRWGEVIGSISNFVIFCSRPPKCDYGFIKTFEKIFYLNFSSLLLLIVENHGLLDAYFRLQICQVQEIKRS